MNDHQEQSHSDLENSVKITMEQMIESCDKLIAHIEYFMDIEPGSISPQELREYDLCVAVRRNLNDLLTRFYP